MKFLPLIFLFFLASCLSARLNRELKKNDLANQLSQYEISKYGLHDGESILDVGSGEGWFDALIFRSCPHSFFTLEDINKTYRQTHGYVFKIDSAASFRDHCAYVTGTADTIPLPSGSFQNIICRKTLHEFKQPAKMLKEMRRLLAPNGQLIIVEVIPRTPGEIDTGCKMRHLPADEIIDLLRSADFRLLDADSTDFPKSIVNGNFSILKFGR